MGLHGRPFARVGAVRPSMWTSGPPVADGYDDGGAPPVRRDPPLAADPILLPTCYFPGGSHRCPGRAPAAAAQ